MFSSHERYWPATRKAKEIKPNEVFGRDRPACGPDCDHITEVEVQYLCK